MSQTVTRPPRAAVVIASGLQGLAVTRALGRRGVPVVVMHAGEDDLASVSRYAHAALRVPEPERDGAAFVDTLLERAGRYPGAVLIPTTDEATRDVARRADELGRHYRLACPSWETVRRAVDKAETYALAAAAGVPIPTTHQPETDEELDAVVQELTFPCLVKPRESHLYVAHFGAKVAVADTPAELRDAHRVAVQAGLRMMVQELIPGPDHLGVNYNAFRAGGAVLADCTARKVRMAPPRFGMPRVVLSADVPEVVEPARALLEALELDGFANVEFKRDPRDGVYKLFEVNCRHNLSSWLSVRCGMDFPFMSYTYADSGVPPAPAAARARTGVYWIDEARDLAWSATRAGRDGATAREIVRPWLGPRITAVYDRRDPQPFINALRRRSSGTLRRARRVLSR